MAESQANNQTLLVEFMFLDLTTCTRCRGADRSLEQALDSVAEVLEASGLETEVRSIHVESAEQARELRFLSSPTIRVNGNDVALELRESSCGSEACTDGCGASISCRVWVHDGVEHTEPPPAMIVDAILREVYREGGVVLGPGSSDYELPENLKRFFAGEPAAAPAPDVDPCCSADEQRSCCDADDKAECCGARPGGSCGCR